MQSNRPEHQTGAKRGTGTPVEDLRAAIRAELNLPPLDRRPVIRQRQPETSAWDAAARYKADPDKRAHAQGPSDARDADRRRQAGRAGSNRAMNCLRRYATFLAAPICLTGSAHLAAAGEKDRRCESNTEDSSG
jgi:hypothetical protein